MIVLSPAVSGRPTSMLPSLDFDVFPLANPGLVAIPASFLLGAIGTLLGTKDENADARHAEMEVRALTGAGSEKATTTAPKTAPLPKIML
jgi:cation/acetate symporter